MNYRSVVLVCGAFITVISSISEACYVHNTCSECLSASACSWCYTNTTGYCADADLDLGSNCLAVINPRSRVDNVTTLPLNEVNQVSLDSINIKLRVGEPLSFNFSVKPAENFPLDLYILMDLSNSYKQDLVIVKQLAPDLVNSLDSLTNNSLIGFGTFVDKLTEPFFSQKQLDLGFEDMDGNPSCRNNEVCDLPVAFEHVSNLTNSSTQFNAVLQAVTISTNADGPEGTLDGMMQATVCTDLIGWRAKSRKMLMVMTDDLVHTAGDGRLGGVTKINDEICHTEYIEQYDRFLYMASTEYDYPSFEQLRLTLRSNGIVPVFAVPSGDQDYFNIIGGLLNGFVAVTASDSSNLIDVVAEAYLDVVSQVSVDYDNPSFLQTEVSLACPDGENITFSSERCNDIGDDEVLVNMTLTLSECVAEVVNGRVYPLDVTIPGFDRFTIFIEGECNCDCDNQTEVDGSKCLNGDLRCGRCYCHDGYTQDKCDCPTDPCPVFNGLECGGKGTCDGCGFCICNEISSSQNGVDNPIYYGDACQCSNFECETGLNNIACSGHGNCTCANGIFMCECSISPNTGEAHFGDVCQCSSDHCVDPNKPMNVTCSGHGTCNPCDAQGSACSCDDNYIGNYCETFIDPSINNCGSADESCIECYGEAAENNEDASAVCSPDCQGYIALDGAQSSSYEIPGTINGTTDECSISTTECTYNYYVGTTASSEFLYAIEPRSCLLLPIWAIAVIIVGGLLIIGIIIIIVVIKLCVMWLNYREFTCFINSVRNKPFQKNPQYQTHVDIPLHENWSVK